MSLSGFYVKILFFWQWSADNSPDFFPAGFMWKSYSPGNDLLTINQISSQLEDFFVAICHLLCVFYIFIDYFYIVVFRYISMLFKQKWKFRRWVRPIYFHRIRHIYSALNQSIFSCKKIQTSCMTMMNSKSFGCTLNKILNKLYTQSVYKHLFLYDSLAFFFCIFFILCLLWYNHFY